MRNKDGTMPFSTPHTQRGRERESVCTKTGHSPTSKKKNKRQRNRTRVCVQVTNLIYDTFDIHTQPPASPLASIVVRQECSVPSVFVNWHGMICASMSTGSGASATHPGQKKTHPDTACHASLRISNEPTSEPKACRTVEYFRSPAALELCF